MILERTHWIQLSWSWNSKRNSISPSLTSKLRPLQLLVRPSLISRSTPS